MNLIIMNCISGLFVCIYLPSIVVIICMKFILQIFFSFKNKTTFWQDKKWWLNELLSCLLLNMSINFLFFLFLNHNNDYYQFAIENDKQSFNNNDNNNNIYINKQITIEICYLCFSFWFLNEKKNNKWNSSDQNKTKQKQHKHKHHSTINDFYSCHFFG